MTIVANARASSRIDACLAWINRDLRLERLESCVGESESVERHVTGNKMMGKLHVEKVMVEWKNEEVNGQKREEAQTRPCESGLCL